MQKERETDIHGGGLRKYNMHSWIRKMHLRPDDKMETDGVEKHNNNNNNNNNNNTNNTSNNNNNNAFILPTKHNIFTVIMLINIFYIFY